MFTDDRVIMLTVLPWSHFRLGIHIHKLGLINMVLVHTWSAYTHSVLTRNAKFSTDVCIYPTASHMTYNCTELKIDLEHVFKMIARSMPAL